MHHPATTGTLISVTGPTANSPHLSELHTAGILGYGHFGRALGLLLARSGSPHFAHDPNPSAAAAIPEESRVSSIPDLAARARTLVLCVPIPALAPALAAIRPHLSHDHFVMDVGSVKLQPSADLGSALGDAVPWCATHPLFGPAALERNERPFRVIICPNQHHPTAAARAAAFFHAIDCETTEQTPDEHDRLMAETHALAFFVARAMLDLGLPPQPTHGGAESFVPPSFKAMAQTIDTVRSDAEHLFTVIQRANPHAAAARERLLQALRRIDETLRRE